jgi:uncharacterized membrane protein
MIAWFDDNAVEFYLMLSTLSMSQVSSNSSRGSGGGAGGGSGGGGTISKGS